MRNIVVLLFAVVTLAIIGFDGVESKKMHLTEAKNAVKNVRKTCASKVNAPDELLDNALKGEFPADRRLQCYLKCIMTMMKAMRGDIVRGDVIIKQTDLMLVEEDAARVKAAVTGCLDAVTSTEGCEAAWQFSKCYYEADTEAYMVP